MNSNNVEKLLDKYYSTFLERNDMAQIVITPQYVEDNREKMENMVRIFTLYPDYLIDVITPTDSYFKLYFYQRLFLRVCMRYREVSGTFPRAYSKSFLDFLAMNIRGIMQPRSKGFTCADTKKQAAQIVEEKTNEIYRMFPFLVNELNISDADKMKKKYGNMGSDYAELKFRNDSQIDIVNTGNAGRGGRRHWGTLEEFAMMDGDAVNEVVIPLMNVDRRTVAGLLNPTEPHAAQTMITTAGYKGTYAHDRTLECLVDMAIEPDKAFCFGGDYRIPVMHGLLSIDKVKDKLQASSYKLESFLREYMSVWTGGSEDSYYSYTQISKCRNLIRPEFKRQEGFNGFYVCGVDVARFEGDQTVAMIFKVFTEGERYKINLVNIKILNGTHFRDQAAMLKQFDLDYNFKAIVMDINGNGAGLADYMIDEQEVNGIWYEPYGFLNKTKYSATEKRNCVRKLFGIEANRSLNSEIYTNAHIILSLKRVSLLLNERQARRYFSQYKTWNKMTPVKQAEKLIPYAQTTKLQDQLSNLKANLDTNSTIVLQRINSHTRKDLVSAFVYGLYYINLVEEEDKKKRNRDWSKAQFNFLN
jgi:hypothetical protein